MKITQMTSPRTGKAVANQFIISDISGIYFQSYESIIVFIPQNRLSDNRVDERTQLDEKYWNYSKTTSKYRCEFLGETTKETQEKIDNGTYTLTNLN